MISQETDYPELFENAQQEEEEIEVTFEVLLSPQIARLNENSSSVSITFGPPLSDWKALVETKIKPGTPNPIEPEDYLLLTGTLRLDPKWKGETIPYKYFIRNPISLEHLEFCGKEKGVAYRCLNLPRNVEKKFNKFDDVILPKLSSAQVLLKFRKLGRETAVKYMLPRYKVNIILLMWVTLCIIKFCNPHYINSFQFFEKGNPT